MRFFIVIEDCEGEIIFLNTNNIKYVTSTYENNGGTLAITFLNDTLLTLTYGSVEDQNQRYEEGVEALHECRR